MDDVTLGLAFIAGLLSFVSPCVLPLVPAYIGYMGGRMTHTVAIQTSAGTKAKLDGKSAPVNKASLFLHSTSFVLGFTLVFVLIGLMSTAFVGIVGASISIFTDIIARVGGLIIIFFGLQFMGILPDLFKRAASARVISQIWFSLFMLIAGSLILWWALVVPLAALPFIAAWALWLVLGGAFSQPREFWLQIIATLQRLLYSDTRGDMQVKSQEGLSGSFILGVVFSAGWTPCIGPLLGSILTITGMTGDIGFAVPRLVAYSLGLGIPFIVAALLLDQTQGILRRLQQHMRTIERVSGLLLITIGIFVASGQLTALSQNLSTEFADFSYRVEECGVAFFDGELQLGQVGTCLNGQLIPVAINQSLALQFTAEMPEMDLVFRVDAPSLIEVEFLRADNYQPSLQILDSDGSLIAEADDWAPREDDRLIALQGTALPAGGAYVLRILHRESESEAARIRVRIQSSAQAALEQPEVISLPPRATESGGVVTDLAETGLGNGGLNTIEELAAISGPPIGTAVGERAPDFTVISDTGETHRLSDYRGQVVLINFWGTWCGPCRREMPEFEAIYETNRDKGFEILALAVRDTNETVQAFRSEFGLSFPLAIDVDEQISQMYVVPGQPSTYIINAEGIIVFRQFSIVTEDQIEPILSELLQG